MAPSRRLTNAAFRRMGEQLEGRRTDDSEAPGIIKAIRDWLIPHSRMVFDDPSDHISLLCPRRAAKTVTNVAKAIKICKERNGARCLLGSMTLKKARELFWTGKDGLKAFNDRFGLGFKFNNSEFSAHFPDGGWIRLAGFETDQDVDKARGEPFDYVGLSECASFPPALLDELVNQAIGPTLDDNGGILLLEGTPGPLLNGAFYLSTSSEGMKVLPDEDDGSLHAICRPYLERDEPKWNGIEFGWSFHRWSVQDNTAMPHLWKRALKRKRMMRWSDDNPIWQREGIGNWVADDSILVYKYNEERNGWIPEPTKENPLGLPLGHTWHYGMGCDLGFDNDFAIQVVAWADDLPCFYQVYEYSAPGLTVSAVVTAIEHARDVIGTDFEFMVGDRGGLGKMIFATLESDHGLSIEAADKQEKVTHVELLNSDLIDGMCKINRASRLAMEMGSLCWDVPRGFEPKKGQPFIRKREAEGFAKDNCDAFLYCCTRAQHRFARARQSLPQPGDEHYAKWKQSEELREYFEKSKAPPRLDAIGARTNLDGPMSWRPTRRWLQ